MLVVSATDLQMREKMENVFIKTEISLKSEFFKKLQQCGVTLLIKATLK